MKEIQYKNVGDYILPDLTLPPQPEVTLGRYAQLRRQFLKEHRMIVYYNLLTAGKLTEHLHQKETEALKMEEELTEKMKNLQGVTEELKEKDLMNWVQMMNNIRNSVQETVLKEVIFA
ncbi:MAG: TnpV protein [Ruminococcus sp.]|nr:TnpV protein [Ruminococcus sp.]